MTGASEHHLCPKEWSRRWDSNPRPSVYETDALPLSYFGAARADDTSRRMGRPIPRRQPPTRDSPQCGQTVSESATGSPQCGQLRCSFMPDNAAYRLPSARRFQEE